MKYTIVSLLCLCYAILRYNVAGDVPASHIPSFIVNKALAFAAIAGLLAAALSKLSANDSSARDWFTYFKVTTVMHILLSLGLFSQSNYPKLFEATGGRLNLYGELMLLSGVLATQLFAARNLFGIGSHNAMEFFKLAAVVATASHVFFLGSTTWLTPEKWPGTIPPISMLCFGMLVGIGAVQAMRSKDAR